MSRRLSAILSVLVLSAVAGTGLPAVAHDGTAHATGAAVRGGTVHETIAVDPDGATATTLRVDRGMHLVLTILGAGAGALHLHGCGVQAVAEVGEPAVPSFDAAHAGRFPVARHVTDSLLGDPDRPILFIEVRAP